MIRYRNIIDISRPIDVGMVLYPGDDGVTFDRGHKGPWYFTKLSMSSHAGTHIDAPTHVAEDGRTVDRLKLDKLVGLCRVLDLTSVEKAIGVYDLLPQEIKKGERILFKTRNSQRGYKEFYADYVHLDDEAAEWLAAKEPALVGTDYLSIERYHPLAVVAHKSLLSREIVLLESLNLAKVEAGNYDLIALPLRLVGLDGAPARAVLLVE